MKGRARPSFRSHKPRSRRTEVAAQENHARIGPPSWKLPIARRCFHPLEHFADWVGESEALTYLTSYTFWFGIVLRTGTKNRRVRYYTTKTKNDRTLFQCTRCEHSVTTLEFQSTNGNCCTQ